MALLFYLLVGLAALLSITSTVTATTYGQKLVSSVLFNKTMPVHKYKTKTGMKVVIAKTGGPQVRGYFCLATNAHDDNGIPHCLEHLVFQGSEDYPYTGSLNLIANRCYAFGTNAFTAKDRTCYYSSHVGKNGFLALLPVFLDHILYPTLTKSTFITEVYHVTGEGEDGGVVFSEMEAVSVDYNWRALLRTVHKDSGYASDTGGSLPNLRENTTHQQNVAYHKKFYRPENLCITVLGDVTIDDVMKSIQKIEKKIASKPKLPRWTRPWKVKLPALKTTTVKTLLPASNEGVTDIYIAWRAPNPVVRFRKLTAFEYLLPYLASSAKPEDFYSSSVTGGVYDFTLYFHFFDVPLDKTDLVYPALIKWLRKFMKRTEEINMNNIRDQIEASIASYANSLETNPYDTISAAIADDFLYGTTRNDFRNRMNAIDQLKYLAKAPKSYWINLIDDYFVDTAYAQSIGIPSKAELDRLTKENEELVPKRKAKLGPEGLKKKAEELANAIAINSRPVPDSVITSVPVPNIGDIDFFDAEIYRTNGDNVNHPEGLDLDSWPIYAEAYDSRTNYIYITITIFTGDVKPTLRPYLYLLLKLMAESKINHDTEMDALNDFKTISFDYRVGLTEPLKSFSCGSFSQTASVLMQVEQWQYDIGIRYLLARLQYTTFNTTMIKDAASSLLKDYIPSALNHEYASIDLLNAMYYKADSNSRMYSTLIQKMFLTSLIASLDNETGAKQVLDDIRILREQIISTANLAAHITADFTKLTKSKVDLNAPWKLFNFGPGSKTLNVVSNTEVMVDVASINGQGEIVGVDQETSYASQHSPGVVYSDPDLPALTVACAYCTQMEGPLWRRVRSPGYSYYYRLFLIPSDGVVEFQLYKASDVVRAYNESMKVINELTQPDAVWDKNLIDSARSAAIYVVVSRVAKLVSVHQESLNLSFEKVADSYIKDLVSKISAVTVDDVKRVAQKYMTKIFSKTEAKTAIVCNGKEGPKIAEGLKKLGYDLPYRTSWEETLLNK